MIGLRQESNMIRFQLMIERKGKKKPPATLKKAVYLQGDLIDSQADRQTGMKEMTKRRKKGMRRLLTGKRLGRLGKERKWKKGLATTISQVPGHILLHD